MSSTRKWIVHLTNTPDSSERRPGNRTSYGHRAPRRNSPRPAWIRARFCGPHKPVPVFFPHHTSVFLKRVVANQSVPTPMTNSAAI
jgi:hypothetical protein